MRVNNQPVDYIEYGEKTRALQAFEQSRELVPTEPPTPLTRTNQEETSEDQSDQGGSSLRDQFDGYDVRHMSPRQMVELSQDLYVSGVINFDEYATLAYQPELQPDYNQTIGALTGEPAEPDRRRDFVGYWEERLTFEQKYNTIDSKDVAVSQRIVDVLRSLETQSTNIVI